MTRAFFLFISTCETAALPGIASGASVRQMQVSVAKELSISGHHTPDCVERFQPGHAMNQRSFFS